jgi:hypothetical protein
LEVVIVGTWGPGPFSNDQALDLCDELGDMDGDEKAERLRAIFASAVSSLPAEHVWSSEVVAAAALVALALPGGVVVVSGQDGDFDPDAAENADDEWTPAILRRPDAALRELALEAVQAVTRVGNEWHRTWVRDDDRDAALERVSEIVRILRAANA